MNNTRKTSPRPKCFTLAKVLLLVVCLGVMLRGAPQIPIDTAANSSTKTDSATTVMTTEEVRALLYRDLLGPDSHGEGCPADCGCRQTPKDCPQWYTIQAVQESAERNDEASVQYMRDNLAQAKVKAQANCQVENGVSVLDSGGWCLHQGRGAVVSVANVSYPMAQHHVHASTRVVEELVNMIKTENIQSINDFGAGIAQYKAAVLKHFPTLDYKAFDGAGNGPEYTKGVMEYFDLTLPLDLPVADWVLSLEVGEHVPSKYEGMVLRNLHRHNRKGIILSWAVLGQFGNQHINNHSNNYIIRVLTELGYTYDEELSKKFRGPERNHAWFTGSLMVFRKN